MCSILKLAVIKKVTEGIENILQYVFFLFPMYPLTNKMILQPIEL
jgi:hypothetical protein